MIKLLLIANRKSHMGFRMAPNLEWPRTA